MATSPHAKAVIIALATAIVETVNEAGAMGAPAGPLFAAMQAGCGVSFDTFQQIMAALVKAGKLRQSGHLYFGA